MNAAHSRRRSRAGLCWFTLGERAPGRRRASSGTAGQSSGWGALRRSCLQLDKVRLRGRHNLANAVAAAAIAAACGVSPDAIACAVEAFRGRAAPARARGARLTASPTTTTASPRRPSVRWPASARSRSPSSSCWAGATSICRWKNWQLKRSQRCRAVVLFGESAGKIEEALRAAGGRARLSGACRRLPDAVDAARTLAQPGDVVLLSPACTSYDAYENFERRGEHFRSAASCHQMSAEGGRAIPALDFRAKSGVPADCEQARPTTCSSPRRPCSSSPGLLAVYTSSFAVGYHEFGDTNYFVGPPGDLRAPRRLRSSSSCAWTTTVCAPGACRCCCSRSSA